MYLHNLPEPPKLIKRIFGLFIATLPYYTEPIWSPFVQWGDTSLFGDTGGTYSDKRQQTSSLSPFGVVEKAKEVVDSAVGTVADTATAAADAAREVAGQAYSTVAGNVATAADSAKQVAGSAVGAVTGAGRPVTQTAQRAG